MKNTFENYLQKIHMDQNPEVLDDDLPDSFDNWLTGLQVDEVIAFAEEWGKGPQDYDSVMMKR